MKNKSVRAVVGILALSLMITVISGKTAFASEDTTKYETKKEENIQEIERALNYIYVNEAEVMDGDAQNIVVSWGDGTEGIENIELTLENEKGDIKIMEPVDNVDEIFLFQEHFETGVYQVTEIKVESAYAEKVFSMDELEMKAGFSVGIENAEIEKSEYITMDSVSSEEVETQIVTLNDDGTTTAVESISEALEDAGAGNGKSRAKKEEVVVVLDPGHDSRHAGAQGNGVKEEVATFKIASYCKAELETYEGVTVYLTREGAACPYPNSTSNVDDIAKRVAWAAGKGADIFVSIHLNASDATGAKGAEVYYSKNSAKGKELSQKIQNELIKIGLYDRKIKDNDAYRVINASQQQGFPGIIIEHAFITNASDATAYLKTEAGLKKLGVADATGIAKYFGLKKLEVGSEIPEGIYTFTNKEAEQCLDVVENEICLNEESKELSQRFEIVSAGGKYYYIKAVDSENALSYQSGSIQLDVFSEKNDNQKWAFVDNGSGSYYLRAKAGVYLDVQTTSDGTTRLTTNKTLGKTLLWTIKDGDGHLKVKLESATQIKGSVVVKWNKVEGATGYYIYRKVKGESWKRIATLKSGTTTIYTDASPVEEAANIYTVKAYSGSIIGGYDSKGVSVYAMKKPVVESVIYGNGKMTVSWEAVSGAKQYYVYRKVNGGSWSKIAAVSSKKLSYKDTDIEDGDVYRYTVRAFNGDHSSNHYSGIESVHLLTPKLVSAKYNSGNVTVKWNKVAGAQGYRVYRKEKGGTWKCIEKLVDGSKNSYTDCKATNGKTYIYTVRAYYESILSSYDKNGVSVTIPKDTYVNYKTTARVNYRLGAGTGYKVAGTLAKGKTVQVVKGYSKKANGYTWYKVKINSKTYYVASAYLKKN